MNSLKFKERGWKRLLSFVLAVVMVFTLLPMENLTSFAAEKVSSNYHDTYAILVSVPGAWKVSGGVTMWSGDLGVDNQVLELVDESECLYGLEYTKTLPDNFTMYLKGDRKLPVYFK